MKATLFIAATILSLVAAEPAAFTAEVVGISDGDTLTVVSVVNGAKVQTKIRLHGVDAPESKQAFGTRAKEALSAKVFGKSVRIERRDVDRYGRTVANVFIGDGDNARLVNRELVAEGFAWHYVKYAPNDEGLAGAEKDARAAKRGLWADAAPVAPWDFRKPPARAEVAGMVWINGGGERYHRPNCRHLDASARAVTSDEAKRTHTPCKVCKP